MHEGVPFKLDDLDNRVISALGDDLNTPAVIVELNRQFSELSQNSDDLRRIRAFKATLDLLGLRVNELNPNISKSDQSTIETKIALRNAARARKDFKESDRIRDELAAMGVVIKDSKEGTTWEIAR